MNSKISRSLSNFTFICVVLRNHHPEHLFHANTKIIKKLFSHSITKENLISKLKTALKHRRTEKKKFCQSEIIAAYSCRGKDVLAPWLSWQSACLVFIHSKQEIVSSILAGASNLLFCSTTSIPHVYSHSQNPFQ